MTSEPPPEAVGIAKVQLSVTGSPRNQRVLVYNEDESHRWEGDASGPIKRLMGKRLKAFFYYNITPQRQINLLTDHGEAPWQDW